MKQYTAFKKAHPGFVLLFRIGDFYEMFDDDAVAVSKAIGLTLTQRSAGVPMAGLPHHQLDTYLRRLIRAGFRVAVADQVQDAAEVKGSAIIQREVTRLVTPGTIIDEPLLSDDEARTLAAVCFPGWGHDAHGAVAVADLSTGAFTVLSCPAATMGDELARRSVGEVLYPETSDRLPPPRVDAALRALGLPGTPQPQWHFRQREAHEALLEQFGVASLEAFGLSPGDPEVAAAGAIVRYLRGTQAPDGSPTRAALRHLRPPRRETPGETLHLDTTTLRALEIERTIRALGPADGPSADGSLLGLFLGRGGAAGQAGTGAGGCRTPMGKRLLREWLCRPPAVAGVVRKRQQAVATLVEDRRLADELGGALAGVQDVERVAARVALGRASPRDLVTLARSLAACKALTASVAGAPALAEQAGALSAALPLVEPVAGRITFMCVEDPPAHLREGGLIRPGINADLDEARLLRADAGQWLARYQAELTGRHGLPSLKVGYNKVFGYYIELPKAQAAKAPPEFSRRQTLAGAERYITPELKQFEDKVTTAEARALEREQELFQSLCAEAAAALEPIGRFARAVAALDATLCMADKAVARRWCRPEIADEPTLLIRQGRHPVLDERLAGEFVPNDAELGTRETPASLAIITGPNMAGKSTFIRQVAQLVLLAHAGSYIPAEAARIGVCDRIFARVGADDALFAGQSTFMVEMTETAGILHHATPRSLVILDEVGRGTSTLDGLALAWAIAEALAQPPARAREARPAGAGPRTFFATHYHELTKLQELLPGRVTNLHVSVREWEDQIVFLHRILPGRTDRSYGLHVAKLAGVPGATVARARQVLETLTVQQQTDPGVNPAVPVGPDPAGRAGPGAARPSQADGQLSLFTQYLDHPALAQLRSVDLDSLTPLQAFDLLRELRARADQP